MKEVLVREAVRENFIKRDCAENKLKLGKFFIFWNLILFVFCFFNIKIR